MLGRRWCLHFERQQLWPGEWRRCCRARSGSEQRSNGSVDLNGCITKIKACCICVINRWLSQSRIVWNKRARTARQQSLKTHAERFSCCPTCTVVRRADKFHLQRQLDVRDADRSSAGLLRNIFCVLLCCLFRFRAPLLSQSDHLCQQGRAFLTCQTDSSDEYLE